jgi:hypothetical protein
VYYICDEVRSFDMMDEIEVRSRFQFAHGQIIPRVTTLKPALRIEEDS